MAGIAGKGARVKVSTTSNGTYTAVAGIDSINFSIDGTNVDVSEFGVDYVQRIQGLKDGKLSLAGNRLLADTNGQEIIKSAFLNDTALYVQVLPDGGTTVGAGFQQQMKVSGWKMDAAQSGKVALSIDLEGSGTITSV